jgi:hypothetical protein
MRKEKSVRHLLITTKNNFYKKEKPSLKTGFSLASKELSSIVYLYVKEHLLRQEKIHDSSLVI